jgi:hypothetical protein
MAAADQTPETPELRGPSAEARVAALPASAQRLERHALVICAAQQHGRRIQPHRQRHQHHGQPHRVDPETSPPIARRGQRYPEPLRHWTHAQTPADAERQRVTDDLDLVEASLEQKIG